jgi:hypothetical protein
VALDILASEYPKKKFKRVIGKNSDYDIIQDTRSKNKMTIEVKFDIKASQTGNLCFEFTNGKKATGICISKAEEIWYVLKTKKVNEFQVFRFRRAALVQYLLFNTLSNPKKQKILFGGDNRRFGLIIIPLKTILEEIDIIGEVSQWQIEKN